MINMIKRYIELRRKINFLKYSPEEIEKIQLRKLRNLVKHAYLTVPYYRQILNNNNITPEDIRTLDDIKKIPITSKKDIARLSRNKITSTIFKESDLEVKRSSGSTGEPLSVYCDKNYQDIVAMVNIRSNMLHGFKLTDRTLKISHNRNKTERPRNPLGNIFLRRATISLFCSPQEILDFYQAYRPNVIRGYISSIYAFALWIESSSIGLQHKPKYVLCQAEMAHDFMKRKVSEVLNTRVIDRYATIELGIVADECEDEGGYHILEDGVLPEIITIGGRKYFVGTNLDNYATPFIRYNTLDICEEWPEQERRCSCGLSTKKIKRVVGRDNDFIKTPKGDLVAPIDLIFFMRKYYSFFKKFRFIQDDISILKLEVVLDKEVDEMILDQVKEDFKRVSQDLTLEIYELDHIPLDTSGKMRIIQSALWKQRI